MLKNILALVTGTVLLVLGFVFSLVIFAVLVTLGLAAWGFWWWKTRALRKTMRGQRGAAAGGVVIEGEAVEVVDGASGIAHTQAHGQEGPGQPTP